MKWIRDGLSLDETKASALMVGFLAILISSIIAYFMYGDISDNLLSLNEILIVAIAGVNALRGVADIVGYVKERKSSRDSERKSKEQKSQQNYTPTNEYEDLRGGSQTLEEPPQKI